MDRSALVLAMLVGSLGVSACGRAPDGTEAPAATVQPAAAPVSVGPPKPLAQKKFGGAITETTSTALDTLLKDGKRYETKTVRTEGVVSAVCKAMGCWMELADGNGQAHIKMAGHSFFVPKDASGHHAVVQGTVIKASNDECSQEAKAQTGAVAKVEIEATGVEFVD